MPRDIADQLLGDIRSKLHVSNPELNAVLTDKFLIRCFRCCHYDEAATIKLVENYEKTLEHLAPLRTRYQLLDLIESGIFKVGLRTLTSDFLVNEWSEIRFLVLHSNPF